jgi:modulator of FtsH protease
MAFTQVAMLPYIIGGIVMIESGTSGVGWLAPAAIFSFLKAILDAWVLLIEINR